jgi:hypothetical protein
VATAAAAARRLHALLCEEGPTLKISTSAGPARCGDEHLVEDATIAEAEAALNLGDPFAALAAADRLEARRKDVDGLVSRSIPSIAGKLVDRTAAAPDRAPSPAFGPLAFDKNDDLLVHTRARNTVRVDHASFQEAPDDTAVRWPTRLSTGEPPSWTLVSVEGRCDLPTLVGRFEIGGERTDVPLPLLTPARCAASPAVPVDLLGASTQGAILSVRGELVAIPLAPSPRPALAEALAIVPGSAVEPGAGRSPDGSVLALSTGRGVLVATLKRQGRGASARLWTAPAADGAVACVPTSGADRIACVVNAAAAIYDAK